MQRVKDEDNIIDFHDLKTISIKENYKGILECKHRRILVTESTWTIECRDCNSILDPIWWLVHTAKDESHRTFRIQNLKEEIEELKRKIVTLNRTKCEHCCKFTKIDKGIFYKETVRVHDIT